MSVSTKGVIFALLATLVWSGNFIIGRELIFTLPPFTLAFYRWLVAFVCVLPLTFAVVAKERHIYWKYKGYYFLMGLMGVAFFNTAIYIAAHEVPALNLSLIAISSPLATLLLGRVFFNDPLSIRRLAGVGVIICGILYLLCRGDLRLLVTLSFGKHDLLMLSAALGFSVYTLLLRKRPKEGGSLSFLTVTFGIGLCLLAPFFVYEAKTVGVLPPWSPKIIWHVLYLGVGTSVFSFWAWGKAIQLIGSAKAAIIYYILPLFCGIEAVLWLNEPILSMHYISGMLIIGGLIVATPEPKRPK